MKNELAEVLEDRTVIRRLSLADLANDPFLARKEQKAIEFLRENPVPKHWFPKKEVKN